MLLGHEGPVGDGGTALENRSLEQVLALWRQEVVTDASTTGAVANQGDGIGVAAEGDDVISDPLQGKNLIL